MGFVGHDSAGQRLRGIIKNGLLCSVMVGALGMSGLSLAADNQEFMQGLFNYQHKMAELGNAEAQFKLAEMYEQGQGVAADPKQARLKTLCKRGTGTKQRLHRVFSRPWIIWSE